MAIAGPPGRQYWGACSSTSPANHHFCVPPTGLVLRDGWSSGQCARWRASRGVSCCGSHYPLPRRCGDVTFSRFVTPLRVRDSYVWFEGALPLTVQLVWNARSCVIKGRGIWGLKTESARARSFCFKSERTSVPSGTPRSERERAKTEKMSLGTRMFKQKGSETGGGT